MELFKKTWRKLRPCFQLLALQRSHALALLPKVCNMVLCPAMSAHQVSGQVENDRKDQTLSSPIQTGS